MRSAPAGSGVHGGARGCTGVHGGARERTSRQRRDAHAIFVLLSRTSAHAQMLRRVCGLVGASPVRRLACTA